MDETWAEYVTKVRLKDGLSAKPSGQETLGHLWCMVAHGRHHNVNEIHPQSPLNRIECTKCRVFWCEPKV
jgi:hypothetical protein